MITPYEHNYVLALYKDSVTNGLKYAVKNDGKWEVTDSLFEAYDFARMYDTRKALPDVRKELSDYTVFVLQVEDPRFKIVLCDILDEFDERHRTEEGFKDSLEHYYDEFPTETDYNYVQYGNALCYYYNVIEYLNKFGYHFEHGDDDDRAWELYKDMYGRAISIFFSWVNVDFKG